MKLQTTIACAGILLGFVSCVVLSAKAEIVPHWCFPAKTLKTQRACAAIG